MSQSPESAAPASADLAAYRSGWSALSQLIGEGHSFSGYERNSAFLNIRGARFANVSACTGLDLIDDGRAIAVCDWDFDGRLDFWLTNRTAPRLRLLRNASFSEEKDRPHFAAFRLQGTHGNRDAIGARVTLHFREAQPPLMRAVRAGDGFLAQSSRWIHFGLGDRSDPARIEVRWPGGASESFEIPAPDAFYEVVEGRAGLTSWEPPAISPSLLTPESHPAPAPLESVARRTWITGRTPFPSAQWLDWSNKPHTIPNAADTPLLVNLWSIVCRPCLTELDEWKRRYAELEAAGLPVLALSVDGIQPEDPRRESAQKFIQDLAPPFSKGLASAELVEAIEIVHRAYLELQQPLPIPATFLLDRRGRIAAIYKGPVSVEQLVADAGLLSAPEDAQRASALPFPGRLASLPFPPDPARIASGYLSAGKPADAAAYLEKVLSTSSSWLEGQHVPGGGQAILAECSSLAGEILMDLGRPQEAAQAWARLLQSRGADAQPHRLAGERLLQQNLAREALPHLERAVSMTPDGGDAALRFNLGLANLGAGQPAQAIDHFRASLIIEPGDLSCIYQLANALYAAGDRAAAIATFRQALSIEPGWPYASRQLAWILATDPEKGLRNGSEALTLAREACRSTSFQDPAALHLLAAALAETGEFAEAVETADRALTLL
ncbi:MAG TPA: ASPIC/UnbV domain-containing protein, partial [Verrucomicrobiales bacterium]|nr:ASPIC/UnbV domain-containing protein [Verrucomicrobiales bacterium]